MSVVGLDKEYVAGPYAGRLTALFLTVSLLTLLSGCGTHAASAPDPVVTDARDAQIKVESLRRAGTMTPAAVQDNETNSTDPNRETSLETLLKLTAERSPKVQAARHRWQAATNKHAQAVSLPDPMLNFKYFVRSVETRTGPQKWSLGLSQRIPYPGKLIIAGKIADKDAQAAYLRYEAVLRDQIATTKETFFELYYIDRAQQVTEEVCKLYQRYAALAAGGTELAKPKLPETFRAESQVAQLGYDLILLREMRTAEEERLRASSGVGPTLNVGPTQAVAEPVPLAVPIEELQAVALQHNQELAAAGIELERAEYQSKLARRMPIPDLTIGADYIKTGNPVPALRNTPDASKDPIALGVGISIPLWFPKYTAMAREAREMEHAAHATREQTGLQLRADLAKAYFSLSNSSRLVRLYRDTLIPQARQALQSAEELHRKGEMNLSGLLETTATVHNFELARLRATADYYQNVARIERLLGTAFELQPAAPIEPPKEEPKP
jgi:outer membrane protein TolC